MKIENTPEHKTRLDIEVFGRQLSKSRSSAGDLIKRGKVTVNGIVEIKTSFLTVSTDQIRVTENMKFVSRAGD